MKKIILIYVCSGLLFCLAGCGKWLDVKPEDRFIEEEIMKTEQGFADVLNGVYIDLGSTALYGGGLTMNTMDILAKYYHIYSAQSSHRRSLESYNYQEQSVLNEIDLIWTRLFTNITNLNKFFESLDQYGHHLPEQSAALFKGEAHALRAFLYFDLMRMFTPAYTLDSTATLLPYYDKASKDISEFRSSKYVMERILQDLSVAEATLLAHDPVIQEAVVDKTTGTVEVGPRPFTTYRNYRLNYYAVKALQARVHLWRGDRSSALAAAKVVIQNQSKFPWTTVAQLKGSGFENRIFSPEMLFGVENPQLYSNYNRLFNSSISDAELLFAGFNSNFLNQVYENQETDYRYDSWWRIEGGKTFRVFVKYQNLTNTVLPNFRFTVPILKLSEVFLIAAECEPDPQRALDYLNELKMHRNVGEVTNPDALTEYIMREYRKEFYGEGQLWYYYKRTNLRSVLSAVTATNAFINEQNYVFPIPHSETDPR